MVTADPAARAALITGGLGGIGRATAFAFARAGYCILLVDRAPDEGCVAAALIAAGSPHAESILCDVADEASVARAAARCDAAFGSLDVVVNVAGAMIYKSIAELSAADWRRLIDINLVGAALFVGEAFRRMQPGGCIVNVASIHARRTSPLVAPYAAAKAALASLTRSAAIEGRALGIRCNAILPGAIDTPMLRESPNILSGAEQVDEADVGQPDDIAELALFLASDRARFITGEEIVADGGRMGRL